MRTERGLAAAQQTLTGPAVDAGCALVDLLPARDLIAELHPTLYGAFGLLIDHGLRERANGEPAV